MSNIVKLSSALPSDIERNGLDSQVKELLDSPQELRVALVVYKAPKANVDHDAGIRVPIVAFTRVEPICTLAKLPEDLKELMLNAAAERTGAAPLPLDTTEIVED